MAIKINSDHTNQINYQQIFSFLVLYRWLSLIPVLVAINPRRDLTIAWGVALLISIGVNILITLFSVRLNTVLMKRYWVFLIDLALCGVMFYLVDGWATPYYLYAFSPLLAAAFFFGLRGAARMATAMSVVYILSGLTLNQPGTNLSELVAKIVGFFLIAGVVGYASVLLKHLQEAHFNLGQAHRDLEVIHSLTLALQSAVDVEQVQERVLNAVTDELGFPRAIIGLVDIDDNVLTGWLGKSRNGEEPFFDRMLHPAEIPLTKEAGVIPITVLQGQPRLSMQITTPDLRLNRLFGNEAFHIFPMMLRDHLVGVLLVGSLTIDDAGRMDSLQSISSQAAVAIGTTMLCIDRAQRLAIQDERIRFAREIHDTVSQSLFGVSYTLDACVKILPDEPQRVRDELRSITSLVETSRKQIRQSIMDSWPSEITAESFVNDLQDYATAFCHPGNLDFSVRVLGQFQQIPRRMRRDFYRIAQESLTNITRHAAASQAKICINVDWQTVMMLVRDDGCGFDVSSRLEHLRKTDCFGLRGIQNRVVLLGGKVTFFSQPDAGTTILVEVPLNGVPRHE